MPCLLLGHFSTTALSASRFLPKNGENGAVSKKHTDQSARCAQQHPQEASCGACGKQPSTATPRSDVSMRMVARDQQGRGQDHGTSVGSPSSLLPNRAFGPAVRNGDQCWPYRSDLAGQAVRPFDGPLFWNSGDYAGAAPRSTNMLPSSRRPACLYAPPSPVPASAQMPRCL